MKGYDDPLFSSPPRSVSGSWQTSDEHHAAMCHRGRCRRVRTGRPRAGGGRRAGNASRSSSRTDVAWSEFTMSVNSSSRARSLSEARHAPTALPCPPKLANGARPLGLRGHLPHHTRAADQYLSNRMHPSCGWRVMCRLHKETETGWHPSVYHCAFVHHRVLPSPLCQRLIDGSFHRWYHAGGRCVRDRPFEVSCKHRYRDCGWFRRLSAGHDALVFRRKDARCGKAEDICLPPSSAG